MGRMFLRSAVTVIAIAVVIAMVFVFASSVSVHAAIYKYKDKKGVESFTNDPSAVPPEFKSTMVLVDNTPAKTATPVIIQTPVEAPVESARQEDPMPKAGGFMDSIAFKAIAGVLGFAVILIAGIKIGGQIGHKMFGTILSVLLGLVLLVFLFRAQLEMIKGHFLSAKEDMDKIKANADERTDKLNRMTTD